jgi:hypothetical protein
MLLLAAFVLHELASEKTRQGITPPYRGNLPGHEDEFFGEDPRVFAARPENQAVLADARRLEGLALAVACGGVLVLVSAALIKRRGLPLPAHSPAVSQASLDNHRGPLKQLPAPAVGQAAARP